jgi:hypothetical protein
MAEIITSISFDGCRGSLQLPQYLLDEYTPIGSSEMYIQKVKATSQMSTLNAWKTFNSQSLIIPFIQSLNNVKGLRKITTLSNLGTFPSTFLMDFSYSIRKTTQNYLGEFVLNVRTDNSGTGSSGSIQLPLGS